MTLKNFIKKKMSDILTSFEYEQLHGLYGWYTKAGELPHEEAMLLFSEEQQKKLKYILDNENSNRHKQEGTQVRE